MRRFNSGRDSLEPEMPRSTYSRKISQPRRDTYSRSSANCISGLCPLHVETLAYRSTRISIPPRMAGAAEPIDTTEQRRESGKKANHAFAWELTQILAIFCAALVFQKVRGAEKAPLLAYRPENPSIELKFWAWGVAVELDDEFDDKPRSIRCLIERQ